MVGCWSGETSELILRQPDEIIGMNENMGVKKNCRVGSRTH
jgi:hypothetical protein